MNQRLKIIIAVPLLSLMGCSFSLQVPNPAARIIAFGDSSTRGPASVSYPDMLPDLLGLPSDAVANEGVGGEETTAGRQRLTQLIDNKIYPNAETIIIWEGGTDVIHFLRAKDPNLQMNPTVEGFPLRKEFSSLLNRIEKNLGDMVVQTQRAGWKVYLVTYFPLSTDAACPLLPSGALTAQQSTSIEAYQTALNARIRNAAVQSNARLVDIAVIGEQLTGDAANYFDCSHLSEQGNALVAALIAEALNGENAKPQTP